MRATLAQAGVIPLPRTKGTHPTCNAGDDTGKKNPCQYFAAANRLVSSKTVCSEIAVNYYIATFSGIHGVINGPQQHVILRGLTPPRTLYRLSDHVSNRHHLSRNFCGPGGGGTDGSSDR